MNDVPTGSGPRNRVVVGVDGTPNSLAALRRAVYQARKRGASLGIVCVIPAGSNLLGGDVVPYCLSRARRPVDTCASAGPRSAAGGRPFRCGPVGRCGARLAKNRE